MRQKMYEMDPNYLSICRPVSAGSTWHDSWKPVDFGTLVVPNNTARLLPNEVAPSDWPQSKLLRFKSSERHKSKALLLETAMLTVMYLIDKQNEEEHRRSVVVRVISNV